MSKKKDKGGSAFPYCIWHGDIHAGHMNGMDLRDWYAGMALQGIIRGVNSIAPDLDSAKWAYVIADAMIKERNKE